jgi:hypothetical protein
MWCLNLFTNFHYYINNIWLAQQPQRWSVNLTAGGVTGDVGHSLGLSRRARAGTI